MTSNKKQQLLSVKKWTVQTKYVPPISK